MGGKQSRETVLSDGKMYAAEKFLVRYLRVPGVACLPS